MSPQEGPKIKRPQDHENANFVALLFRSQIEVPAHLMTEHRRTRKTWGYSTDRKSGCREVRVTTNADKSGEGVFLAFYLNAALLFMARHSVTVDPS